MPQGDRSGPAGLDPRTGRSAGFCAGYPAQLATPDIYLNSYPQRAPQEEAAMVRSQIGRLEENLRAARKRLGELKANKE